MFLAGAGQAAGRTQTLRFFDKPVSITFTHADGTVIARAPFPEPRPGDMMEVNSLDYPGTHAPTASARLASTHLRCLFRTGAAGLRVAGRARQLTADVHRQPGHTQQRHRDLRGRDRPRRSPQGGPLAPTTPPTSSQASSWQPDSSALGGPAVDPCPPRPSALPHRSAGEGRRPHRQRHPAPLTARRKSSALDGLR